MQPVAVTVQQGTRATPDVAFAVIPPIDLPSVFTGYGPLPAVTGERDRQGDWTAAGDRRILLLAGGGELEEQLVEVRAPELFAYRVTPVKGPLTAIVSHIDGRFEFTPAPGGGSLITWTYAFTPRRGRRPAVLALAPLWRRYAVRLVGRFAVATDAACA